MKLFERLFRDETFLPRHDNHLRLEAWPSAIYAIGDVHGCLDALLKIEQQIKDDANDIAGPKLMVLLGDYVDRGPDSARVIAHLLDAPPAGFSRLTLAGNHEAMMLSAFGGSREAGWLELGGAETLRSYGIDPGAFASKSRSSRREIALSHVPVDHVEFLRDLPLTLQVDQTVFAHAGIRRGISMPRQEAQDVLWIRQEFLDAEAADGLLVVHGHTPVEEVEVHPGRIAIDTAVFATGRLSAIRLAPDMDLKIFTTSV